MKAEKMVLYPIRLSSQDVQALRDYALVNQVKPTVWIRELVRENLINPPAASA